LYPLRDQLRKFDQWTHELALMWNYALEQRRSAWQLDHHSVSFLEQQSDLSRWRSFDADGLGRVPFAVAQSALQRLDLSFRAFFRNVKTGRPPGFPRFRRSVDSFSFVPSADPWTPGPKGTWRLKVPCLAAVPVQRHRPPPNGGTARFVTIRREVDQWFVSIAYLVADPPPPSPLPPERPVGIDVGLLHLAALSDGTLVEPPRYLNRAQRQLARDQRRLARRRPGSHRRERQRVRVARRHRKVERQRRWFAHQLSHDWAERFDLVAMEDLNVAGLGRGWSARSIHDAGWSMLRTMTQYKAGMRSHRFIAVDPRYTSQRCSRCGALAERTLSLSDREFACGCGHRMDRDVNAARNIEALGIKEVGRKPAEVTRGERAPLSSRVGRRAYQRRQAPSMSRETPSGRRRRRDSRERARNLDRPER
ncbi:MAG: RNA-guided endonuclease InsQ/TnpB family protein, partial [Thermoplasmata archaeon]